MKQAILILMLTFCRLLCFSQDIENNPSKAHLDKALVRQLDTIYHDDQDYRLLIDSVNKKNGQRSKEMRDLWEIIRLKDSIDQVKVTSIIDKYGWMGADIVGTHGNTTLFLVIQHADFSIQEKYLPLMRDAVKKGNARGSDLALLEDRVALWSGKKQIYGSQISEYLGSGKYVAPLEDPDNVDKRRAEVGLRPMSVYLSYFDMKWDLEQYKKDLPLIEAKEKALNERAIKK